MNLTFSIAFANICKHYINYKVILIWGRSSPGRALEWHSRGSRFDPDRLHHDNQR